MPLTTTLFLCTNNHSQNKKKILFYINIKEKKYEQNLLHYIRLEIRIAFSMTHSLNHPSDFKNINNNPSHILTQALCDKYTRLKPTCNVIPFFSEKPRRTPRST